jgi:pimeloyl-ACP methyl ester carboxylesterase
MRENFILCETPHGAHRIAYREWGDRDNSKVLTCLHGLTRNSQDFDLLAQELQKEYYVICPDIFGHGKSDWLTDPENYVLSLYVATFITLLRQLNLSQVDWLGTSLGGIIGNAIASQFPTLIKRLILNDIGAFIPKNGLRQIAKYLRLPVPHFGDFRDAENYIRYYYASFGDLTDKQWQIFTKNTIKPTPEWGYTLHHDPKIGWKFPGNAIEDIQDINLWEYWRLIRCPVLILHGENSNLLFPETIRKMQEIHPQTNVIHLANCGHAPALMDESQIKMIQKWLLPKNL